MNEHSEAPHVELQDDGPSHVEGARAILDRQPDLTGYTVRHETRTDHRVIRAAGQTKPNTRHFEQGIGVQVFVGVGQGYAHTHDPETGIASTIEAACRLARANARALEATHAPSLHPATSPNARPDPAPLRVIEDPIDHGVEAILPLLVRAERTVAGHLPDAHVQTGFGFQRTTTVTATREEAPVRHDSLQSTLIVQVVARDNGRVADGNAWLGGERGLGDYEASAHGYGTDGQGGAGPFYAGWDLEHHPESPLASLRLPDVSPETVRTLGVPESLAAAAAREAMEGLHAKPLTAGRHRTLTDNHLTGMMVHESFGHLTEHDLVASGWSVLRDRLGQKLANDVTIRDTPSVARPFEGVNVPLDGNMIPGRPAILLDNGILTEYLHSASTAQRANAQATGNGRALGIAFEPIVRMRNTSMDPGRHTFDEALEALGEGAYLIGGRGGSPRADGSFMFTAQRGYAMRGGKIVVPTRMTSIHGNVLDFMKNIEATTRDHRVFTTYFGGCGKWDQSFLHIGSGGPHVLVTEALVGGHA